MCKYGKKKKKKVQNVTYTFDFPITTRSRMDQTVAAELAKIKEMMTKSEREMCAMAQKIASIDVKMDSLIKQYNNSGSMLLS